VNNYLIPANSKKSLLKFGYFTWLDLGLFGAGVLVTLLLLFLIHDVSFGVMLLMLLPAIVTGFLVMPVNHYHNVLQFIINVYTFYNGQRKYLWKGWSINEK